MRRLYILLFCILFVGLIAKPCFGEEVKRLTVDGYEWESWTESWKAGWVIGFYEGIEQAGLETSWSLMLCAMGVGRKLAGTVEGTKEVEDEVFNEFEERTLGGKGTYGQMVIGLDEFYKDYRNKKVLVREASFIVKLELKGAPQEFIEEQTRIFRMPWEDRKEAQKSLLEENQEFKRAWERWGKYLPLSVIPLLSGEGNKEEKRK